MDIPEGNLVWDELGMEAASVDFGRLFPEYAFDGRAVLDLILRGHIWEAVREMGKGITGVLNLQTDEIRTLFITVLILGIAAALFINFADLFRDHQISDLAFYFVYLLMVTVLVRAFSGAVAIVRDILTAVTTFMQLYIPTYMAAVGSAGGAASAAAYYQVLLFVVYLIERVYLSVLLPIVHVYLLLTVINGVWMEEKLALLLELLRKVIDVGVKAAVGIITGFSLLQAMISPVIDSLQASAFKKAMAAIPGIGGLTEGMLEMVIGSAVLIKNGIGLYLTLALVFLCAVPLGKLLLYAAAVKAGAALTGIVSDRRMANCVNRVGDGNLMLLKIALSAVGMFLIQIAVITYTAGGGR